MYERILNAEEEERRMPLTSLKEEHKGICLVCHELIHNKIDQACNWETLTRSHRGRAKVSVCVCVCVVEG